MTVKKISSALHGFLSYFIVIGMEVLRC